MTAPPPGYDPYQQQSYPLVPYQQQPMSAPPGPYSPGPVGYVTPYSAAPYGLDPMTGYPMSDKSKVVAGLLQMLPGFFIGLGGVGRLYAGNTGLGITQICLTVVGWISFWCGFLLIFPFMIYLGLAVWFVVDGIVMLAGRPVDGQGRPLRS